MSITSASGIDKRLLTVAARLTASPEDLSEAVNGYYTPAQAANRVYELLKNTTQYDANEKRLLLLVQMLDYLEEIRKEGLDAAPTIRGMFKNVSDQIERVNNNMSEASTRLAKIHAQYFVEGYTRAMQAALQEFASRNSITMTETEFIEISEAALPVAQEYVDEVTEREVG